jgi:hypothetical protein
MATTAAATTNYSTFRMLTSILLLASTLLTSMMLTHSDAHFYTWMLGCFHASFHNFFLLMLLAPTTLLAQMLARFDTWSLGQYTWVLGHFDAPLANFVVRYCFDDADHPDASSLQYLVSRIFGYLFALMLGLNSLLARSAARSDNWTFRCYDARLDVSFALFDVALLLHCC